MFRCKRLWRAAFASAIFISLSASQACAGEEARTVNLKDRLVCGWTLLRDNTLYPERLPDWRFCQEQFSVDAGKVDQKTADEAMSELIGVVHDDYTFFRDRTQTAEFRENIERRNVVHFRLEDTGVGYVKVDTFSNNNVAQEVREALRRLASADSYVLDLRGNQGGLIHQAFLVYSMFVDQGLFASFKGRKDGNRYEETLTVTRKGLQKRYNGKIRNLARVRNLAADKPLVIFVDGDTRSAAELLAGALHECGRARLLGSRTFGKGVVQNTWTLTDGSSVRITTGRSYLPKSGCIDGRGLEPDVVCELRPEPNCLP